MERERARDGERASEDVQRGKGRAAPDIGKKFSLLSRRNIPLLRSGRRFALTLWQSAYAV